MADLGNLIVSIGTDLKELDKGLGQAQKTITGFQQSANKVLGLIGFSLTAAAFVNLGKATLEYGDTLNKLALQTGLTASEIAKLKYVAEQSETSVDAVATSFRFLSRSMNEAASGNAEAISTFAKFHVEFRNADGTLRNYQDVMLDVADRIKNTSNDTVILAEGQKLLGRNVMQILPLLRQGSEGIKKLNDQYREMQNRVGLTDEEINKFAKDSDALNDAWKDVGLSFRFMLVEVMTPLLPKMKDFTQFLVSTDWQGIAAGINTVASAFEKVFGWIKLGADTIGTWTAGMAATLGTLAGGGTMDQAGQASADKWGQFLDRNQPGSEANPIDLGSVTAGGGQPQGGQAGVGGQGIDSTLSMFDQIKQKMDELKAKWGDVSKSIGELWKSEVEQIASGFGTATADMIVDGKDFGESMKQMWKDVAKAAIAEIVSIIAQQIILFTWQAITGTLGSGNLAPGMGSGGGGRKKFLGIFDQGGFIPQARAGLVGGAGIRTTGNIGESGFMAKVHPNEIISPIDKFFDAIKSMAPTQNVFNVNGRAADDPQLLAELVQLEGDRQRRRP